LIDDDREARGTAEQLTREVATLMKRVGPEADKPILPTASAEPTEEGFSSSDGRQDEEVLSDTDGTARTSDAPPAREEHRPRSEYTLPVRLFPFGAAVVGGLLVFLGWEMHRIASDQQPAPSPWIATPEEVAQFAPDAGVGEETTSVIQDVPRVVMPLVLAVGAPMPKKPLQGQKRPPCGPELVAVNGACWAGPIKGREAPCPQGMFDHEGECYVPIFDTSRQPTSEEP
jgi:hypothetical protein